MKKYGSLAAFLLVVLGIGVLGSIFTQVSVKTWYPTLIKTSWTPPPYLFGPVWTALYIMIAISGWLIYISPRSNLKNVALTIYGIQLFANLIWSALFFSLKNPVLALLDLYFLFSLIVVMMTLFFQIRRSAGYLLIPYFLWTAYALSLNAGIVALN